MKIAGQYTPFWGGQHARFLQSDLVKGKYILRGTLGQNTIEENLIIQ